MYFDHFYTETTDESNIEAANQIQVKPALFWVCSAAGVRL